MPEIEMAVNHLEQTVRKLDTQERLAFVDVACATLVFGSADVYKNFRVTLSESVRSDGSISLFEWVVMQILRMRVELPMAIRGGFVGPVHNANISQVAASARRTLGVIAMFGSDNAEEAKTGFQSAIKIVGLEEANMPTKEECTLDLLATDMDQLETLRPSAAGIFIKAALSCVAADQTTTDREYLLLRALSERLSIPLPPTQ